MDEDIQHSGDAGSGGCIGIKQQAMISRYGPHEYPWCFRDRDLVLLSRAAAMRRCPFPHRDFGKIQHKHVLRRKTTGSLLIRSKSDCGEPCLARLLLRQFIGGFHSIQCDKPGTCDISMRVAQRSLEELTRKPSDCAPPNPCFL